MMHDMLGIPVLDWIALCWFFGLWFTYDRFTQYRPDRTVSLLGATYRMRRTWMEQMTLRDNRISDAAILSNLSSSPTFFASTTMIVIGGLFALLGTGEQAVKVVAALPFAELSSARLWEVKVLLLIGIFIYAFFRFTWALRQFNFSAIMVGACGSPKLYSERIKERHEFADRAGKLIAVAAETFNDGLRAYYFAIAATAWFLQPMLFMVTTLSIVAILYQREFHSRTLKIMLGQDRD